MSGNTAKAKPLKIGIVCEGQRGCAETQVFPHLVKLLCPHAILEIVPTGNRPTVLAEAPKVAKRLFDEGCSTVFVMWDVFPEWRDHGGTTDCTQHRKDLVASIKAFKQKLGPIFPVAIREELEAWLFADGDALSAAMSKPTHKVTVGHEKKPDEIKKPKAKLARLYRIKSGVYNESVDAGKIAANWATTARIEKSQSFKRFADKVRGLCARG